MSDLPVEKKTELTTEQKFAILQKDVVELARGVNTQAQLLEAIVVAFDGVLKKYLELTKVPAENTNAENPKA